MEVVEAGRRRDPELGDDNKEEAEAEKNGSDGEAPEVRLLRSILEAVNPNQNSQTMTAAYP